MNHSHSREPDFLAQWIRVKRRGALRTTGEVYRSSDGTEYLRTGALAEIREEARLAREMYERGFPVAKVTAEGVLPDGRGYFAETSLGEVHFGVQFAREYTAEGRIAEETFERFVGVMSSFVGAQLRPEHRRSGTSEIRQGIQLANVLEENPDLSPDLVDEALAKVEERTRVMPLVPTHGDLSPFNVMDRGVIDFEQTFVATFGVRRDHGNYLSPALGSSARRWAGDHEGVRVFAGPSGLLFSGGGSDLRKSRRTRALAFPG